MTIFIKKGYDTKTGRTDEALISELVKAHARTVLSSVTDLTNNSGGTPAATLVAASTSLVNAANSGTSLVSTATAASALGTVVDAIAELYTKANAYATKLGLANVVYSGGGAAADGTIGAITVSTTAATTGAQASNINTDLAAINTAIYNVAVLTNEIMHAVKGTELVVYQDTLLTTIPSIPVATGSAADPGVTKVAMDAELVKLANNVASIAATLNTANDALTATLVTAVK